MEKIHICIKCGRKLLNESCPKIDEYGNHWCKRCYEAKCANEIKKKEESYDNIKSLV